MVTLVRKGKNNSFEKVGKIIKCSLNQTKISERNEQVEAKELKVFFGLLKQKNVYTKHIKSFEIQWNICYIMLQDILSLSSNLDETHRSNFWHCSNTNKDRIFCNRLALFLFCNVCIYFSFPEILASDQACRTVRHQPEWLLVACVSLWQVLHLLTSEMIYCIRWCLRM